MCLLVLVVLCFGWYVVVVCFLELFWLWVCRLVVFSMRVFWLFVFDWFWFVVDLFGWGRVFGVGLGVV